MTYATHHRTRRIPWHARTAIILAIGLLAACTPNSPATTPPASPAASSAATQAWQNATITLPGGSAMACPTGHVTLAAATTPSGAAGWAKGEGTADNLIADLPPLATGDLTGDGKDEIVLRVRCTPLQPHQEQDPGMPGQLLIATITGPQQLQGIAYTGPAYARYPKASISGGLLHTQVWYETENSYSVYAPAHMRSYQWTGSTFTQTAGRTTPLVLAPAKAGSGSPVTLPGIRDGQATVCAATGLVFTGGTATTANATFTVTGNAQLADLDGDGNDELLTEITCTTAGAARTSLYLLRQQQNGLSTVDVPVANNGKWKISNGWKLTGSDLKITLEDLATGAKEQHIMRWNGTAFTGKAGTAA